MSEASLTVTELSLSPEKGIPRAILDIIDHSVVYSINELLLAKDHREIMYILANAVGEFIGYCIVIVAYPFEVAEGLDVNIGCKVLWIDVLEIASSSQGNNYGRTLVDYLKNKYFYKLFLMSTEESIGFWQRMGLGIIHYSGTMAYMIS